MKDQEEEIKEIKEEVSKPKNNSIELTRVITETEDAFQLPDGKIANINAYLVWLGNQVLEIKRSVA